MGIDSVGSPTFRKLESSSFGTDGKIDTADATKLGEAAKTQDPAVAKQVLNDDAFESSAARDAYAKAAGLGKPKGVQNSVAGQTVGGATIRRTLGAPEGYENKLQAIASARQSGVANAGVVQQNGRWYPVELNKAAPGALPSNGNLTGGLGLTPFDQTKVDTLRAQLKTARAGGGGDVGDLTKQLAAAVTGLPKESFNVIGRMEARVETKLDGPYPTGINIQNGLVATAGARGTHGPAGAGGEKFDPSKGTAVTIDAGEFEGRIKTNDSIVDGKEVHKTSFEQPTPEATMGVLEHEATHLQDFNEAKDFVDKWPGKAQFQPGDANGKFRSYMMDQAKHGKVDWATAERVLNTVGRNNNDTEAHAHVATAVDAIRNGSPDIAKEQLVVYAKSQKGAPGLAHSMDKVFADAKAAYDTMTKDQKAQFKAAIKAANDQVGKDSPLWGFDPDKFKPIPRK